MIPTSRSSSDGGMTTLSDSKLALSSQELIMIAPLSVALWA